MNNFSMTSETLRRNNLTPAEIITLLMIANDVDYVVTLDVLYKKSHINYHNGKYTLMEKGQQAIDTINFESAVPIKERCNQVSLAKQLKSLFPKGKKPGTNQYWAEGEALIAKRLHKFYDKYGKFDDDIILQATKKYIEGFNGDYRFMRTLKYFIWAEKVNASGELESTSDLLTYIENAEEENFNTSFDEMRYD